MVAAPLRYADLPIRPDLPPRSAWGLYPDPRRGALSTLGPDQVRSGVAAVRSGEVFALNLELGLPDPPLFGRRRLEHLVHGELGGGAHDDELVLNTQSSSQWDGFRHVAHPEFGHFGGLADDEHGIDAFAEGICGRAVLLDVARAAQRAGEELVVDAPTPISASLLERTVADHQVELHPGDLLFLRTGWLNAYRQLDLAGRSRCAEDLACCGLEPSDAVFAFLFDHGVAAVAADNPSLELWPLGAHLRPEERRAHRAAGRPDLVFGHYAILALLGIPIGELFDLDAWAEAADRDHRYDALVTSAPLRVRAGVASPPNAVVVR